MIMEAEGDIVWVILLLWKSKEAKVFYSYFIIIEQLLPPICCNPANIN